MPVNITEEFVRQLMVQIDFLTKQNSTLTAIIAELNQTIKELKEQLNKNAKNSSKPSLSDGLKKPAVKKDRSLRKYSGKSRVLRKVTKVFIFLSSPIQITPR